MLKLSWNRLAPHRHWRLMRQGRPSLRYLLTGLAVLIFFAGGLSPLLEGSAQVQKVSNENTVYISAEPQRILPGATTTITVHMSSVKAQPQEKLLVSLPKSLQLVGTPDCTGDCSQAGATPGSNELMAFLRSDGTPQKQRTSAQLTFTVLASSDAKPGTYPQISAYLGSPAATDWIEISIETPSTSIPSSLSIDVGPDGFVVGPNGSFIVFVHPYSSDSLSGQFNSNPAMKVEALVPSGLRLEEGSDCFAMGSSSRSLQPLYSIEETGEDNGISHVSIDIPEQEQRVGILLPFENTGLDTQGLNSINFTLSQTGISNPANTPSKSIDIKAVDSLASLGADESEGSMNVLITARMAGCTEPSVPQGVSIALAEWGDLTIISTSTTRPPKETDSIAFLEDYCPMLISFKNVEPHALFDVGAPGAEWLGCRRCVLGVVPWSNNAIPIIKNGVMD